MNSNPNLIQVLPNLFLSSTPVTSQTNGHTHIINLSNIETSSVDYEKIAQDIYDKSQSINHIVISSNNIDGFIIFGIFACKYLDIGWLPILNLSKYYNIDIQHFTELQINGFMKCVLKKENV